MSNNNQNNSNPYYDILKGPFFTIPNLICVIRILLIIPFVIFFLDKNYIWAGAMVVFSAFTDCFDGFIARTFNQESEIGKLLDPLADKLTLLAVGICLCTIQSYLIPLISILVLKDLAMLIGSSKFVKKGILVPKAKWYGKLGTVLFYMTVTFIVFVEITQSQENPVVYISDSTGQLISIIMMSLTVFMMLFALVMYGVGYRKLIKEKEANSSCD